MKIISKYKKIAVILLISILLSGFTSAFVEKVPPLQDLPKKTTNKNAGIVIPAFNASPHDILAKSYDPLSGLVYDENNGLFMYLSTSIDDFDAHKLTFHHKKFGFVTTSAYKIWILFSSKKTPQRMEKFFFHPFEPTKPKLKHEAIEIADDWVKFFDSLGWPRSEQDPNYPYGLIPETGGWPYMKWNTKDFNLSVSLKRNESPSNITNDPRYFVSIVFSNRKKEFSPNSWPKKVKNKNVGIVIPSFDASPFDILENSYDKMDVSMYDEEDKTFASLSAHDNNLLPRKFTFYYDKFGFMTKNAYDLIILFKDSDKKQKIDSFSFSPFKKTEPKLKNETIQIADGWVKFFDSLGWVRKQKPVNYYQKDISKEPVLRYMTWHTKDCELLLNIKRIEGKNNHIGEPKYIITILIFNKNENNFHGYD